MLERQSTRTRRSAADRPLTDLCRSNRTLAPQQENCVFDIMKRRNFLQFAAAGAAAATNPGQAAPIAPSRPVLFHAGTQQGHSPEVLQCMAAFGLKRICSGE